MAHKSGRKSYKETPGHKKPVKKKKTTAKKTVRKRRVVAK